MGFSSECERRNGASSFILKGMKWIDRLKHLLGEDRVIDEEAHRMQFAHDESRLPHPYPPDVVVHPRNLEDVIQVMAFADQEKVPVVPRGGGTSVTGGSLAVYGGIMLVFDHMTEIKEISPGDLMAVVQPGIITGTFHQAVESVGLFYPPDPASLDSCSLGGNVAENAGGPRALKYGVTKHYVLELEVVLPGGVVYRIGRPTKKWVAGYDLVSLLVGSEGTLGVITEITLRLLPKPPHIETLLVSFPSVQAASKAVTDIFLAGILPRTLELMDHKAIEVVRDKTPPNLPPETEAILIFEVDGQEHEVTADIERSAEIFLKHGALEIFMAQNERERSRLWEARRGVLLALEARYPRVRSEDLVFPRTLIPQAIEMAYEVEATTGVPLCTFGHIGDGNLHVNLLYEDEDDPKVEKTLRLLYERTVTMGGTISGEHGIGFLKKKYLPLEQPPGLIQIQKAIKTVWDPHGILNPGKVFPD